MAFDCDVLIAGGGPTGMAAALGLTQLGHSVHIVEKHATGLDFSRAIFVNSSTMALLQPFGVAEAIARRGRPVRALAACGPAGPLLSGRVEGQTVGGVAPTLLPQLETEECLREALAARGVVVERPCELLDFAQDDDGVTATLAQGAARRTWRARFLIGADGFHSRVRGGLGVAWRRIGPDMTMYGADVVMAAPFAEDACVFLLDEGAGMALRCGANKVRLAATSRAALDAMGFAPRVESTTWESPFVAHFAQAEPYGAGRVWLAGDAAHVHSPVGGRGMNMGVADGLRLARAVHDGDFAAYERERKAVATPWVRANLRLSRVASWPGRSGALLRSAIRGALRCALPLGGDRVAQTLFRRIAAG